MIQFPETPPLSSAQLAPSLGLCLNLPSSWPTTTTTTKASTATTAMISTSSCMEQLLVHCALAIDRNDATLAHQILWVLNTLAPADGDSTQRLVSAFLRSLIIRASRSSAILFHHYLITTSPLHRFSPLDLASFLDLTPFHRFGYSASNAAISDAVEGFPVVHIVDLSTTHCMQIPTLIDLLSTRLEGPPYLKLTVPCPSSDSSLCIPPMLDFSYDELGSRLVSFARSRNVAMEFRVVPSNPTDGFETLIDHLRMQRLVSDVMLTSTNSTAPMDDNNHHPDEALVINCQMLLHYIPDETASSCLPLCMRSEFLKNVRCLHPNLVTLVDEDVDLTARDVVGRLRAAYNYLWIQYDVAEALMGKGTERRRWYEAEVAWRIENVIGCEGLGRVERGEGRGRWAHRMRGVGFREVGFAEEAIADVKGMLEDHAAGWGLKKEDEGDLIMTWKGHNVIFATAWVPSSSSSSSAISSA